MPLLLSGMGRDQLPNGCKEQQLPLQGSSVLRDCTHLSAQQQQKHWTTPLQYIFTLEEMQHVFTTEEMPTFTM